MKVAILGAGNIGTQFAVMFAEKGHEVRLFTSRPQEINKVLEIVDESGKIIHSGEIQFATDNMRKAVVDAEFIFITFPSFMLETTAAKLTPYVGKNTYIGLIPGTGGGEYSLSEARSKGAAIFGLQRVPGVARLKEYGKTVCVSGIRPKLHVGTIPRAAGNEVAIILTESLNMPCEVLPNYLNVTLTPSNPILHTTRLRTLFSDYREGIVYKHNPLFYGEWDDASSELLIACDDELQHVCKGLSELDLSMVHSLKRHYKSDTVEAMTQKISSIKSLAAIKSPVKRVENGFIPDFSSRYFTADFPYGLAIIQEIARLTKTPVPNIDETMSWYCDIVGCDGGFRLKKYGIQSLEDLYRIYR